MLKNIKACIFDMDGTLLDSMHVWRDIDVAFLRDRNLPMVDHLQQQIEGLTMAQTAVWFRDTYHLSDSVDELMAIWNRMAMDAYANKIQLKKGARDFLRYLKQHGVRMGIATSNSRELVEVFLTNRKLLSCFDVCVTSDEVEHGKPAPDIYLLAARDLGAEPENCLVFEDILPGIDAGHNAGMKVCAVEDDYSHDIQKEKIMRADYFIHNFYEIPEMRAEEGGRTHGIRLSPGYN